MSKVTCKAADAKQGAISTVVLNMPQLRVMDQPAERTIWQTQFMLVSGLLDDAER
ncbi:hypothetical protein PoHVEF18_005725 [Penicillium ochrochloron]